jgi:hypothetical protein
MKRMKDIRFRMNWCLVLKRFEIAWLGHGSKRPTSGALYAIANRNGAIGNRFAETPHHWYQCPWYRKPYTTSANRRIVIRAMQARKLPIA